MGGTLRVDTEAISPVVGIVLLLGITVVLAAFVAFALTGFGDSTSEPPPTASYNFEFQQNVTYNATNIHEGGPGTGLIPPNDAFIADQLEISHASGGAVDPENIRVKIRGSAAKYVNETGALKDFGKGRYHSNYTFAEMENSEAITSGGSVTLTTQYGDLGPTFPELEAMLREATVLLIYENENGEQGYVLDKWEGPEA